MDKETEDRLKDVIELLFKISQGDFTHRIPVAGNDDMLEVVSGFLNQISESLNLMEARLKIATVKNKKDIYGISKSHQRNTELKKADLEKIKMVGYYIEKYPEKRISSLYTLAVKFGTNEYKLKKGFKQYYGISVFRFQKKQRLRKAHLIIQTTQDSINEISRRTGFKNASHFSKVFKKQYGYSPISLKLNPRKQHLI